MMVKRTTALTVIVVTLAVATIQLRHLNRLRFVDLQRLQMQRDALDTEWGQLLLEQATWSEHRRVEGMARQQLGMLNPRPEQTTVVIETAVPHK